MKKLSILICIFLIFGATSAFAEVSSENIMVTGFEFLVNGNPGNTIASGDSLSAEIKLKTSEGIDSQNFTALIQTVKEREIIKAVSLDGSISSSEGEKTILLEFGTVDEKIIGSEIIFHLVEDLDSFKPLAPKGTFNCSNPLINKIRISGRNFYYENSSEFTALAPRVLPLMVWADELPLKIYVEPSDLTTKIIYNDVSTNGGLLTVSSVSHSGAVSETVADVSLDIPSVDQLASLAVNGIPVEGFSKDIYEYVIPVSGTDIPELIYEKVEEASTVTYTPPAQLPGKASITVSCGGTEKTYTVIFASEINIPLLHAGYKRTGTNGINVYDTTNLPATRTILSDDALYADYTNRRVYLEYDNSVIPSNAVIASGTLSLWLKNANADTVFNVDVLTASDKDWYENSLSYKSAGNYPHESEQVIYNGNAPDITKDTFSEIIYNLNTDIYNNGTDGFNLVLRQRYNESFSGMNSISFGENEIPVMKLYYYINE